MPMFDATCSHCGCETQVPFQPRGDKPVLCRQCYDDEIAQERGLPRQTPPRRSTPARSAPPAASRPETDAQTTALAVRTIGRAEVLALAPNQAAEVTWAEVRLEPAMTYKVGRLKTADGRWVDQLGVFSNVWDLFGQLRGLSFAAPRVLENTEDRAVVEVTATYLNADGREVRDTEVYEIDCARLLKLNRLKWTPKEGSNYEVEEEPVYDAQGNLIDFRRKLPPSVEKEIWDNFLTLKRFKLAKAITCAHRRLIQRALGTKTLTPDALALQFPIIRKRFTDAQIEEAVASIYGDEDEVLLDAQGPAPVEGDVTEAEFSASPDPAPEPAPQPEATAAAPPADEDDLATRKELYRQFWPLAKECGDKTDAAVRQRLAEWKCCAQGEDGRPSLKASTIQQIRDVIARYERLKKEQEQAAEVTF